MKTLKLVLIVMVVFGLLLPNLSAASAFFPPLPSLFTGTVKVNGANVPLTTKITAWINGVQYAEDTVHAYEGNTVYDIDVPGDDLATPEIEGGKTGEVVIFMIGDLQAVQTGVWASGTPQQINLSADPTIQISETLPWFASPPGIYSAVQSYTVAGMYLPADLVITAPANFEISLSSNSGYTSTLTFHPTGGNVAVTTIYVRFKRDTPGVNRGVISHTSSTLTVNLDVLGTTLNNYMPLVTKIKR